MDQQDAFLYTYLFYNFHVHSTYFERSCRSSSGVDRSVLYYTALYNRAHVVQCNTVHCGQLLMMNDKIFRNM